MELNLTNCYHTTNETRAQLLSRLNDFSIAAGINTTNFTAKCYRLAVFDADVLGLSEFRGVPLPSGSLVVAVLQYGDANADGVVTFDDYNAWNAGYQGLPGSIANVWEFGAFNGQTDAGAVPSECANYLAWASQFLLE